MKKVLVILLLAVGLLPSAFAGDTLACKMVFYRDNNIYGAALSQKVFVNGVQVVKLRNNSFFTYSCESGTNEIMVNNLPETAMQLKVAEGKTYYFRFDFRQGFWISIPEFILVDSISAYPAIHNGSMRELDGSNRPLARPADRFGINVAIGGGLVNHNVITLDNGEESSISYGGGIGFGVKYGHEFTRNFDMAIDLDYRSSSLRPTVSNGTVSFDRFLVGITPAYIIPIDGGDAMRIKVGAGPDFYFYNALDWKTSKISGGFNDKWLYKSTYGFHVSANYEMNFSESWSVNYGLKYYYVNYKFKSGDKTYPTNSWMLKPDGSGIEVLIGVNYHF